ENVNRLCLRKRLRCRDRHPIPTSNSRNSNEKPSESTRVHQRCLVGKTSCHRMEYLLRLVSQACAAFPDGASKRYAPRRRRYYGILRRFSPVSSMESQKLSPERQEFNNSLTIWWQKGGISASKM